MRLRCCVFNWHWNILHECLWWCLKRNLLHSMHIWRNPMLLLSWGLFLLIWGTFLQLTWLRWQRPIDPGRHIIIIVCLLRMRRLANRFMREQDELRLWKCRGLCREDWLRHVVTIDTTSILTDSVSRARVANGVCVVSGAISSWSESVLEFT